METMKAIYVWMNTHMKVVAICWIILPMLTAVFPALASSVAALAGLASLFFWLGDYGTDWWDEVAHLF